MSLYHELKRRNVFRVGAAYIVAAWLIIQVVETIFPLYGFGDTPARIVVTLLAIGFPLFLIFSWVFEFTPEGLMLEKDVKREAGITPKTGKKLDRIIIVLLALALGYFAFDKFVLDPTRDDQIAESARQEGRSEALIESYGYNSIAVLPFVNMSSDPEQEYFSDGISEELLNLLARIPELRVISRSSAFSFKGKDTDIPTIAAQLNVAHILEGSVRKAGNQVRITAQLIEARSDTHLWSETYDRELANIFALQDEIAGEIASNLQVALAGSGRHGRPTDNEEAHDNFLRGWHFIRQGWTKENIFRAKDYYSAAIELDPDYAQAHAQLAMSLITLGNFRISVPTEVYPAARQAALTALELNDDLLDAHYAQGWIALSYDFDWRQAEVAFRRAIELAPSNFMGHYGLSWALQAAGRYDEALAAAKRAHELDPLTIWTRNLLGEVYYKRREYNAALEQAKVLVEMQPSDALGLAWIARIYTKMNMPLEAARYAGEAEKFMGDSPNLELPVALAWAQQGNDKRAREIMERIMPQVDSQFMSPGYIAMVYANLAEKDLAFTWLERAVESYDSFVFNLNSPNWDPIRSDPRFIDLCARLRMACAGQ